MRPAGRAPKRDINAQTLLRDYRYRPTRPRHLVVYVVPVSCNFCGRLDFLWNCEVIYLRALAESDVVGDG